MGKGRRSSGGGKSPGKSPGKGAAGSSKGAEDDDALLDAAIATASAEKLVLQEAQETAAKQAAAAAATSAAAAAAIIAALNELPVFTVADKERRPLQFKVSGRTIAVFFADVAAAEAQRSSVLSRYPDCDLLAVGLGSAYQLSCDHKAVVVPDLVELRAAGAPADAKPLGQELPLFMCPKLTRVDGGASATPLFMSHADCVRSAAEVGGAAGGAEALGTIRPIALQSVVEQLSNPESEAYSFVAPAAAVPHVQACHGKGRMQIVVEASGLAAAEDDAPPLV